MRPKSGLTLVKWNGYNRITMQVENMLKPTCVQRIKVPGQPAKELINNIFKQQDSVLVDPPKHATGTELKMD